MAGGVKSLMDVMGWNYPAVKAGELLEKIVYISDAQLVQTKFGERVIMTIHDENFDNPVRVFLVPNKVRMRLVEHFKNKDNAGFVGPVKITRNGRTYNIIPA